MLKNIGIALVFLRPIYIFAPEVSVLGKSENNFSKCLLCFAQTKAICVKWTWKIKKRFNKSLHLGIK